MKLPFWLDSRKNIPYDFSISESGFNCLENENTKEEVTECNCQKVMKVKQ